MAGGQIHNWDKILFCLCFVWGRDIAVWASDVCICWMQCCQIFIICTSSFKRCSFKKVINLREHVISCDYYLYFFYFYFFIELTYFFLSDSLSDEYMHLQWKWPFKHSLNCKFCILFIYLVMYLFIYFILCHAFYNKAIFWEEINKLTASPRSG